MFQVETEKHGFFATRGSIFRPYIPSAMPGFASSIDFWSPFFSVGGVFALNSLKTTVPVLHLLSAALPLSLGCCLHDSSFVHGGSMALYALLADVSQH